MGREIPHFQWPDYLVFSLVLVISAGIGLYYACTGGKQKTTKEFLMADRGMSVVPVSLSLLASFMSAITLLGTPAEIYIYGTQYWMIAISYCFVVPISAYIFIPVFYKLGVTSAYEYLELRFGKSIRTAGSLTFSFQMILYMAIVLYAPSLALNAVTGFNLWAAVISVGAVCTFYTTLGGMKAVMWTDTFQIVMMFAGLFAVLIQGSVDQDGFDNIWRINDEGKRIEFFNFDAHPGTRHTVWSLAIGGIFTWVAIYGVNQAQVQRALTCPTLRKAQLAYWLNLPGLLVLVTVCSLCGQVIYAQYKDCDPLGAGDILAKDQLLPLYVMDRLSHIPGLPGLFTACLFSGALSTISSGLNSLSAVVLQDLVRAYCFKNLSEEKATLASKIIALLFGIIMIALTWVASQLGGILQAALALFGMIGGPLLGVFCLGMFYPWANKYGAGVGLATGLIVTFWIGIGAQVYKPIVAKAPVSLLGCPVANSTMDAANSTMTMIATTMASMATTAATVPEERPAIAALYQLSYMWYSAVGTAVVSVVGIIVSLITGPTNPEDLDPRLICPAVEVFCCCLPKRWRKRALCGVKHPSQRAFFKDISATEAAMSRSTEELDKDKNEGGVENIAASVDSVNDVKHPPSVHSVETHI